MVREIEGDLLEQYGVLCHQTNFYGVMGGGIAAAIQERLLSERAYQNYVNFCAINGKDALGKVEYLYCKNGRIVANCFSQNEFAEAGESLTNYAAMRKCFANVRDFAIMEGVPVFIPYGMGCGIARGSWEIVRAIIDEIFGCVGITAVIVRKENWKQWKGGSYEYR